MVQRSRWLISATEQRSSPSTLNPLRDPYAMLSPTRVSLARKLSCPPKNLQAIDPQSPLCDLRAMLSPIRVFPAQLRRSLFKFETSKTSSPVRSRNPALYRDFFGRNLVRERCE
jgi:hypothetical protein